MTSIVYSKEDERVSLFDLTDLFAFLKVGGVVFLVVILLTRPFHSIGPGLTASPVADKVLVTGIDESLDSVIEEVTHLGRKVSDPVSKEEGMHHHLTIDPLSTGGAQSLLYVFSGQELIHIGEVIAQRRVITLLSDIIYIETGSYRYSQNSRDNQLASFQGGDPDTRLN